VYFGPEPSDGSVVETVAAASSQRVAVPLGEILPMLIDAANTNRAWLQDFADDEVAISADLYEVLTAYQQLRNVG
jgi:hypothetical protein